VVSSPTLPDFAHLKPGLAPGTYDYLEIFPRAAESPAMARVCGDDLDKLLTTSKVNLADGPGFAYVDVETPCIVLAHPYYQDGDALDLYLDMLHELTHLRQLRDGADLWDERYAYVDRITEVEGYAVAVEEGRRLGMGDAEIFAHLHNPWMTQQDVERLIKHIDDLLAGRTPNVDAERV